MIPFNKTTTRLTKNEKSRIVKAIEKRPLNGEFVSKLEEYFRNEYKVKYAIACANATTGLTIAIRACGLHRKKASVPSFTWYSTIWALQCNNCKPLFCDVDPDTWLINEDKDSSDFIFAVDTFGNKSKVESDKPVIYDAAHSFGLSELGNRGIAEVVSLSFTKVTPGMQGGIILTNDEEIYKKCVLAASIFGKMGEINAIVALNSINNYKKEAIVRKLIINLYRRNIEIDFTEQMITETNNSVYSILFQSQEIRDRIVKNLIENNIEPKVYYTPLRKGLVNTDDIYSRILSLPLYSSLTNNQIKKICRIINKE